MCHNIGRYNQQQEETSEEEEEDVASEEDDDEETHPESCRCEDCKASFHHNCQCDYCIDSEYELDMGDSDYEESVEYADADVIEFSGEEVNQPPPTEEEDDDDNEEKEDDGEEEDYNCQNQHKNGDKDKDRDDDQQQESKKRPMNDSGDGGYGDQSRKTDKQRKTGEGSSTNPGQTRKPSSVKSPSRRIKNIVKSLSCRIKNLSLKRGLKYDSVNCGVEDRSQTMKKQMRLDSVNNVERSNLDHSQSPSTECDQSIRQNPTHGDQHL